ncbi:TIGR02569 family protein [Nonomuraea mangrovi]|uniref:TIGR02569 family protein n=1 Tax=Nonomuraea mangrovi TaxID=2316207 RepID=A0ABW4T7Y6_9ACTN
MRVGDAVLKPVDDREEAEWSANVLARLAGDGFRVPRPLASPSGDHVVDGWSAAEFLCGRAGPIGRWPELLAAGRALHEALRGTPRPAFLDRRSHPWAVADRVAWEEVTVEPLAVLREPLARLAAMRRPVDAPHQIIHGDLAGNVLFADGSDPAVIDFSPYWRPAAYGEAIAVADGLLWWEAGPELIGLADGGDDFRQLLVRALIFRLVALDGLCKESGREVPEREVEGFVSATDRLG